MSTPVIRQAVAASVENAVATVTLGAGTAVGDLLLIFHGNDFYTAAALPTPTSSQTLSGLSPQGTADQGSSQAHVKFWTAVTTVAGTQTVSGNRVTDEEVSLHVIVLDGSTVNTASFIDGTVATGGATAATTAMVAPAVSPSTADALLVSMVQTNGATSATPSFTQPSGMTERTDVADGFFAGSSTAFLVLSASGTTGTKTCTCTASQGYATVSVAIKGGAPSQPVFVKAATATSAPASTSATATFGSATTPGNLLVLGLAGDKNTGTLTASGWTPVYSLPSTSVSLYLWWKVSAGESSASVTWSASSATGSNLWVGEYADPAVSGSTWQVSAQASHVTDETNVNSWASGTTGAATAAGIGI